MWTLPVHVYDARTTRRTSAAGASGFFFQAEDGIGVWTVTGVQTCALPISSPITAATDRQRRMATRRSWTAPVSGDERRFSISLITRSIQKERPRCSGREPEESVVTVAMYSLGNPLDCLRCAETPAERVP